MEGLHLRNTLWPIDQTTAIAAAAAADAATMTTDSQIYLILPSIQENPKVNTQPESTP